MKPLQITSYTLTTALGAGLNANLRHLRQSHSGLRPCRFFDAQLNTWAGEVEALADEHLAKPWESFDCRNNRLSQLGLRQDDFMRRVREAAARYGAGRIGVFIGTSTSGIHETERAYLQWLSGRDGKIVGEAQMALPDWYRYETTHNTYAVAEFVRARLGLEGVATALSTACSSSAKVFASAARAIESGFCDAAVVGGTDTLCLTTLYGFNALQLISEDICRPSDPARAGLSIGEATGFALLEKPNGDSQLGLLGYGESSDAHHMSSPHPQGEGARLAMQGALRSAGCEASAIDYVHLHGTATPANDLSEAKAVEALFGDRLPCSSTKGWTGHTLGAAGIVGAAFSLLCLQHSFLPRSLNTREVDPQIKTHILLENRQPYSLRTVMSNAFGFGGNNCSLVLGGLP